MTIINTSKNGLITKHLNIINSNITRILLKVKHGELSWR